MVIDFGENSPSNGSIYAFSPNSGQIIVIVSVSMIVPPPRASPKSGGFEKNIFFKYALKAVESSLGT